MRGKAKQVGCDHLFPGEVVAVGLERRERALGSVPPLRLVLHGVRGQAWAGSLRGGRRGGRFNRNERVDRMEGRGRQRNPPFDNAVARLPDNFVYT